MDVGVLDYGAGNLHSLAKAIERFGVRPIVSPDWDAVLQTDALVLPGVGAFGAAVASLPTDSTPIRSALQEGLPCLGICLGMQLLFESSEEAGGSGIGLIPGSVKRLEATTIPHMGWNDVEVASGADPEIVGAARNGLVAYFANSYVCHPADDECVVAWSHVDGVRFPSVVRAARTWGVQFHPEKSSAAGLGVIERFVAEARA